MPSWAAVRDGKRLEMAFSLRMPIMKALLLAGIVVAALGALVLTRGISFPSHHSMLRVGDLQASVQEEHAVPRWLGIAAVAGGALMIGAGLRRKRD
jgi:hypothetical protein